MKLPPLSAHRLATAAALSLATASFAAPLLAEDTPRPAKVHVVAESETKLIRQYPAIVFPSQEAELSFRVSGRLTDLHVRGAMDVTAGQVIAELDPRDFETQLAQLNSQREQAVAQLEAMKTGARPEEIAALEAGVAAAQAQLDQARDQTARTKELVDRGVAAATRLEQDEANLRVAEANLRSQQEQLAIGRAGGRAEEIAASEAALRGLDAQIEAAERQLSDTRLTAPFAGIIARRDVENFTNIQAGQPVVLLQALSTVHMAFDVPGPDVLAVSQQIANGVTTEVRFDGLDVVLPAELIEFQTQADAGTQTYRGRVAVELPFERMILPGMVGQVTVTVGTDFAPELTVPNTALAASADGRPFVWLVDTASNTVSRQSVTLGAVHDGEVAVTEGLNVGATVVSAGVSHLQDGMAIRPVTKIGD